MAAETAKVDPGIEDAKPLLPGVGVLIDTEKLVEGAPDVYYLTVYGKRYYGTSPETTVNNVREYANAGLIKKPIKGPSFLEKAKLAGKGLMTRKGKNSAAAPAEKTGSSSFLSRFTRKSASGATTSTPSKSTGPSFMSRFTKKSASGPAAPPAPKAAGSSFMSRFGKKSASGPAATPTPTAAGSSFMSRFGKKANSKKQNAQLPKPQTGPTSRPGNNISGTGGKTNAERFAEATANVNSSKIGPLKPGETITLKKPLSGFGNNNNNITIKNVTGTPKAPVKDNVQARMIAAAKAKKEEEARKAAAATIRPGEFNSWMKESPQDPYAKQGEVRPPAKVPNVNLQDGGVRKHTPRHVTRRPKSMFSKPRRKLQLLAPTH